MISLPSSYVHTNRLSLSLMIVWSRRNQLFEGCVEDTYDGGSGGGGCDESKEGVKVRGNGLSLTSVSSDEIFLTLGVQIPLYVGTRGKDLLCDGIDL